MQGAPRVRLRLAVGTSRVAVAALVLLFGILAGGREARGDRGGAPSREGSARHEILPISDEVSVTASDPRADTVRELSRRRWNPSESHPEGGVSAAGLLFLPALILRSRPRRGLGSSVLARRLAPRGPPGPLRS